ncbi:MAG: hypothetical protein ABWK53_07055, partial [Anaerolineales bacterium]
SLNPQDPQNASPDEFLVYWTIPIHRFVEPYTNIAHTNVIDLSSTIIDITDFYRETSTGYALPSYTILYAQRPDGAPLDPQSPNPEEALLAQLLAIEGNDIRNLVSTDSNATYFPSNMTYVDDLGTPEYGNIIEVPLHHYLPYELQTKGPFLIEVGQAITEQGISPIVIPLILLRLKREKEEI